MGDPAPGAEGFFDRKRTGSGQGQGVKGDGGVLRDSGTGCSVWEKSGIFGGLKRKEGTLYQEGENQEKFNCKGD